MNKSNFCSPQLLNNAVSLEFNLKYKKDVEKRNIKFAMFKVFQEIIWFEYFLLLITLID